MILRLEPRKHPGFGALVAMMVDGHLALCIGDELIKSEVLLSLYSCEIPQVFHSIHCLIVLL